MSTAVGRALTNALDGRIGPYGLTICFQVMPELDPEAYAELKADIQANGIHNPVIYDQNDQVIDGHHRLQIADELDLDSDEIPWTQVHVSDPAAGRDMAYRVNTHRRHLTRDQKRAALERSLRADPHLSDRQHAERVGSNRNLAGAVRRDLEAAGDVSPNDTRIDAKGRQQPATKPVHAVPVAEIPEELPDQTRPVESLRDISEHAEASAPRATTAHPVRPAPWQPAPEDAEALETRRDIEAALRTAQTICTEVKTRILTIVRGSRLGEKGLVTSEMVQELRAAIDLLEGEL